MTQATLTPNVETDTIGDIDAVRASLEQQRQAALDAFHRAVVSTARGQTPDDLRGILSAAGVSVDEFQQSVTVLVARLAASRQQAEAAEMEPRVDAARSKAAAAREALDIAEEEAEQRLRGLREAAADAGGEFERLYAVRQSLLTQADATLHRTAHPTISERLADLEERRIGCVQRWSGEQTEFARKLAAADAEIDRLSREADDKEQIRLLTTRRQALMAERDKRQAEHNSEYAAIAAERTKLEADRMDPVAGLKLGVRETTQAEKTSKTLSWLKSTFGIKATSYPDGTVTHR